MLHRQMTIGQAAPWLVSSVSGLYIMARARHLSVSEASDAKLAQFLFRQSDVVLILCGCPALWYAVRRRQFAGDLCDGAHIDETGGWRSDRRRVDAGH